MATTDFSKLLPRCCPLSLHPKGSHLGCRSFAGRRRSLRIAHVVSLILYVQFIPRHTNLCSRTSWSHKQSCSTLIQPFYPPILQENKHDQSAHQMRAIPASHTSWPILSWPPILMSIEANNSTTWIEQEYERRTATQIPPGCEIYLRPTRLSSLPGAGLSPHCVTGGISSLPPHLQLRKAPPRGDLGCWSPQPACGW